MNEEEEVKYFTVTQYNTAIKNFLDSKPECQDVHLKGEISNYKGATRGHLYFTLKDEESRINAVMFSYAAGGLDFVPKDGDEVLVDGKISTYVASGQYQVYIDKMKLAGNGDLLKKLEELKKKLQAEGLFDEAHKKPIPKYPERIGIVTAPNKAAIKDILSAINRRFPLVETILFPAIVQGELAAPDIVRQIEEANKEKYKLDTLIVGRGGGSIEDLWAFNEEIVARAIYASNVPIISGVGHEIDFTIADFVADKRATTPTQAVELATPNIVDIKNVINTQEIRLNKSVMNKINNFKDILDKISKSYVLTNPLNAFEIKEQKLDGLYERLNKHMLYKIDNYKTKLERLSTNRLLLNPTEIFIDKKNTLELYINKLELLNPLSVLSKGYSATSKDGHMIKSVKDVKKNDKLEIKLTDGIIDTVVEGVK